MKIKANDVLYLQGIKQAELNKSKVLVKDIGYYKFEQQKIHSITITKFNTDTKTWQILTINSVFGEYYAISHPLTTNEIKNIFGCCNLLKLLKYQNIKIIPKSNQINDWIDKSYSSRPLMQKGLISIGKKNKNIPLSCYTITGSDDRMSIDIECWSTGKIITYATACYNNYFIHL
ncbi:hypothetical protein [Candidatus Xenohaliotis californiensis]